MRKVLDRIKQLYKRTVVKTFYKWLNHHTYFRYGYFLLLMLSILYCLVAENHSNTFILFVITVIFLGIGFYDRPAWVIFLLTVFTVLCRAFLPAENIDIGSFFIQLFTYLLIVSISVGLRKITQKVEQNEIELTMVLSNALDSRDSYTMHHSENVAKYALMIAKQMKLSKEMCTTIYIGGLLHDIGKIGIQETILNKPGKLTDEEYQVIKTHPMIGYDMIKNVDRFHEDGVLDIVLYHHERYDGSGYPLGLRGSEIPFVARIVAVADAFDAMTSNRVYRDKLELDYALNEIRENIGIQFDPQIAETFLSLFDTNEDGKLERLFSNKDVVNL